MNNKEENLCFETRKSRGKDNRRRERRRKGKGKKEEWRRRELRKI